MHLLIVGFGNDLVGDDGCGPAVMDRLRQLPLPQGVRLEDGHTDSLRLCGLWAGEREVWLVDALVRGAATGTIHRLDHHEVTALPQRHATAHRLSLPESLRWLAIARPEMASVRYRLWGIEPKQLELGQPLSEPVAGAVRELAAELCRRAQVAGTEPPAAGSSTLAAAETCLS